MIYLTSDQCPQNEMCYDYNQNRYGICMDMCASGYEPIQSSKCQGDNCQCCAPIGTILEIF